MLVLRRSNVARILLVISASVTALLSLLSITSGISLVVLIAAVATIVLLFAGGASAWFKRLPAYDGGYGGHPAGPYGQSAPPQQPSPYANPYGSQPGQDSGAQYPPPPSENPYGQPRAEGGPEDRSEGDHPPRDYPGR